jgi:hypothetical protein
MELLSEELILQRLDALRRVCGMLIDIDTSRHDDYPCTPLAYLGRAYKGI